MTPLIAAALIPAVQGIVERVIGLIPDPEVREKARLEAAQEAAKLIAGSDAGQVTVNVAEASAPFWFAANWRPFIGWVCGLALALEFLVSPLLAWGFPEMQPMPDAGDELWVVVTGILGLGALRTVEKTQGVAR